MKKYEYNFDFIRKTPDVEYRDFTYFRVLIQCVSSPEEKNNNK
ncbi:hypothetical protein CRH01_44960 [Chryseobacterium rhizosphaerae]|nr:hypothetical protein CRH01_44960 [Chryseobacterium rhizosphaerae]